MEPTSASLPTINRKASLTIERTSGLSDQDIVDWSTRIREGNLIGPVVEPVELEFDIRNWFKMGPVPYHNVVAVIPGTTHKDEWVVLGAHFDSFDGGTGAVDDGSGFSPGMEAMRLIKMAGGGLGQDQELPEEWIRVSSRQPFWDARRVRVRQSGDRDPRRRAAANRGNYWQSRQSVLRPISG